MINKLKKFAIAILVTGATVTATRASATTETNVLENISVNLTVYQQYVPGASVYGTPAAGGTNTEATKILYHTSSLTTKDLIEALGSVTGSNTVWTGSPKLVYSTIYSNAIVKVLPLVTNSVTNVAITSSTNTNVFSTTIGGTTIGTNTIETTNITITNATLAIGTNAASGISTNTFVVFSNGVAISTNVFTTNSGYETIISASPTNGTITNFDLLTLTGTSSNYFYAVTGKTIKVMYGTPAAPAFADVSTYFDGSSGTTVYDVTGKALNTTNTSVMLTNTTTESAIGTASFYISYFSTTSGSNLNLSLGGIIKKSLKIDTIAPKKGTNVAIVEDISGASSVADVTGSGYTGGTYYTNTVTAGNEQFVDEYVGTNFIDGNLSNTVPVVVQGTITVTFLKNLAQ